MIEEKKFDFNSLIGFVLIALILIWMLYQNSPTPEEIEAEQTQTEQVEKQTQPEQPTKEVTPEEITEANSGEMVSDSLRQESLKNQLGSFAYAATLPSATDAETTLENDVIALKISNKGG
ncbi:MAG: membrane protein insertase YidC, partial [Flavobacteriaceae bacterium]